MLGWVITQIPKRATFKYSHEILSMDNKIDFKSMPILVQKNLPILI